MTAYDNYFSGQMVDTEFSKAEEERALSMLPKIG
jgi:hypothetical protein